MRNYKWRISLLTLMVIIALFAGGLAWLRPITADEAIQTATGRFRETPGAAAWKGCATRAVHLTSGWCVDFINPATGQPFVQIMVDEHGKASLASILMPGGQASVTVPNQLPRIPAP
jgi:hypothetical protein